MDSVIQLRIIKEVKWDIKGKVPTYAILVRSSGKGNHRSSRLQSLSSSGRVAYSCGMAEGFRMWVLRALIGVAAGNRAGKESQIRQCIVGYDAVKPLSMNGSAINGKPRLELLIALTI